MSCAPFPAIDWFLHRDGAAASIPSEQQGTLIRVTALEVHHVLSVIKTERGAIVSQVAQAGIAATRQNQVPQIGQLRNDREELRLPAPLLAVGPEIADDRERVEKPRGEDVARHQLTHGLLASQAAVKVNEAMDHSHHLAEGCGRVRTSADAIGFDTGSFPQL